MTAAAAPAVGTADVDPMAGEGKDLGKYPARGCGDRLEARPHRECNRLSGAGSLCRARHAADGDEGLWYSRRGLQLDGGGQRWTGCLVSTNADGC
jgi:hypothetical protein